MAPRVEQGAFRRRVVGRMAAVWALAVLTVRDAVRSRVLLGLALLTCAFGAGALLWPADLDRERVIVVQRFCLGSLSFFGIIAAVFLAGSSLPQDMTTRRIYTLAAKPMSRFGILAGKTLGILAVVFIFLLMGGVITVIVTHVASARRTYAGGSFVLEVISDGAAVKTDAGPVPVTRGQTLVADARIDGGYRVTVARRDVSTSGTIEDGAVRLHVRALEAQRVAAPAGAVARCVGRAEFARGELVLLCNELAPGDAWSFRFPPERPARGRETDADVRMRFIRLQHEDISAPGRRAGRRAHLKLSFRNPASGEQAVRELDFALVTPPPRPDATEETTPSFYEEVFALPAALVAGQSVEMLVDDCSPRYPESGRLYYDRGRLPVWRFARLNPAHLPEGEQTVELCFAVQYLRGMELIDSTDATAQVRNPATGRLVTVSLHLRDMTKSYLHFPRELVDAEKGVELSFTGIGERHRLGHSSREAPVYLLLRPDSFWASTARSLVLLFLHLGVFTVLAVAASTFLSAPVAIVLTLVVALSGAVKDFLLSRYTAAELAMPGNPFALAEQGQATFQQAIGMWIEYLLSQLLIALAPGFRPFSSTEFIRRGWTVPWSAVQDAAGHAVVYMGVCFGLGYLMFRSREFE